MCLLLNALVFVSLSYSVFVCVCVCVHSCPVQAQCIPSASATKAFGLVISLLVKCPMLQRLLKLFPLSYPSALGPMLLGPDNSPLSPGTTFRMWRQWTSVDEASDPGEDG